MNKVFLVVLTLFGSCEINNSDSYYKSAYEYLNSLPEFEENGLNVYDSLVHIELSYFHEELYSVYGETTIISLDSMDGKRINSDYRQPDLPNLFQDSSSVFTVFFSEVIDNMLLTEIIINENLKNKDPDQIRAFNNSKIFLFVFKEHEITDVYFKEIQYD